MVMEKYRYLILELELRKGDEKADFLKLLMQGTEKQFLNEELSNINYMLEYPELTREKLRVWKKEIQIKRDKLFNGVD